MHVQSEAPARHDPHLPLDDRSGEAAGGQDDTYGFALEAHPGKLQGRPPTNTGSQPIEQQRPARPRLLPDAPVPDGRTVLTTPGRSARPETVPRHGRHLPPFIPVTNPLEGLHRQIRTAIKTRGHFPDEQAATKLISLAIMRPAHKWRRHRTWTAPRRSEDT